MVLQDVRHHGVVDKRDLLAEVALILEDLVKPKQFEDFVMHLNHSLLVRFYVRLDGSLAGTIWGDNPVR